MTSHYSDYGMWNEYHESPPSAPSQPGSRPSIIGHVEEEHELYLKWGAEDGLSAPLAHPVSVAPSCLPGPQPAH